MSKQESPHEKADLAVHVLRRLTYELVAPQIELSNALHGMKEQIRRITEVIPLSVSGGRLIAHLDAAIEHLNCLEIGGLFIEANHYREEAWDKLS